MSKLPTTQKALFIESPKGAWAVREHEVPAPDADEVLVRVEATGLNPADWKIHDFDFMVDSYPAVIGFDGAGVVVGVGEDAEKQGFKIGDSVFFRPGNSNNRRGTFQQYATAPTSNTAKIPANVSFDQAATLPTSIATAGIRFYTASSVQVPGGLGLTAPWNGGSGKYAGEPILILGGSSAVGQAAIQFAAISGLSPIITTVSPSNNAFVKSLGATHPLDRSLDAAALTASVRDITAGKNLRYVIDAISTVQTQATGYRVLADIEGGLLITDLPAAVSEEEKAKGKKVEIVNPFTFQHPQFVQDLFSHFDKLLETGEFKPNRVEYVPGGIASIPYALERLKKNQVSAAKLVVRPQELA